MSVVISLLLVLLWFSSHACDARSFGVLRIETAKEFHHSVSKEHVELNPARVSSQPERKAALPNDASGDIAAEEISRCTEKDKANSEHKTQAKGDGVQVSWRVPHKKGGQPEAGFNLDYLPPKTHPPVHN